MIVASLAFDERYGLGFDDSTHYPERIDAVTLEEIRRVAQKYIDLDRYILEVLGPQIDNDSNQ